MKQILIALLVAWTTCSMINAQNQTTIIRDSVGKVKVTVTKQKNAKADTNNTAVTVIGVDATDADSTSTNNSNINTSHSGTSFAFNTGNDDFPFMNSENAIGGGILIVIISVIAVFGLPVFILFIVFFFRYKNRKARYRLAEQALAAGQPLPENFIRENKPTDQRSQGIKNTFTGIGLFIFLWAITDEFSIGTIGLLVMFMGLGQWLIGYTQQKNQQNTASWNQPDNVSNTSEKNIHTEDVEIIHLDEKNEENK